MDILHHAQQKSRVSSANNPVWMDALRIALGLFLFIKGVLFLQNTVDVFALLSMQTDAEDLRRANMFFSFVHMIGGLMIAFGALTRLALLLQIPILVGAALLVNPQNGFYLENTELWLSFIVLGLLLFFMIIGPGRYSVDNLVLRPRPEQVEENSF
ncbi:DoxX family protein [Pontibacter harenae]|uniref:DoxX family protein n=1 Tax=Pontibacter harenae TaxID=2894083 RepID=UPI001E4F4085|nr:DoxX family protein [Pontibacter harenae]MCC9165506.1 DoxX family protein [Pontibacter harenae]